MGRCQRIQVTPGRLAQPQPTPHLLLAPTPTKKGSLHYHSSPLKQCNKPLPLPKHNNTQPHLIQTRTHPRTHTQTHIHKRECNGIIHVTKIAVVLIVHNIFSLEISPNSPICAWVFYSIGFPELHPKTTYSRAKTYTHTHRHILTHTNIHINARRHIHTQTHTNTP